VKHLFIIVLVLFGYPLYADTSSLNLAIPGLPQNYQSDRFRAGDLDCSNAIGSATQLEFGVTGVLNKDQGLGNVNGGDIGVYSRIVIPLGKRVKSRVDCNKLYELELKKKQLEVFKLEQELEQLKALQFEN
jgi:hypothetical protein